MAAITVQSGPDDNWLGKTIEEVLEPDIPTVYPHHHLWLRSGYTYLMPELAADLDSGPNIVATVLPNAIRCIAKTARKRNVRLVRLSLWPGRQR